MQKNRPQNEDERLAMEEAYAGNITIWERHVRDLRTGVPEARVLVLPAANFYIFLSNGEEIVREMRKFFQ